MGAAVLADLDPEGDDHLEIVLRSAEAEGVARDLLRQSVTSARARGHSWAAIGATLGMSRQAVQQRFGGAAESESGAKGETRRVAWTGPSRRLERDGWQVAVRAFPWVYLVRDRGIPAERQGDEQTS